MKKPEHTSARVLKIAARALRTKGIWVCYSGQERGDFVHISDADFRACMASLVQKTSRTKSHRGKGAKKLGREIVRRGLKRPRKKPGAKVWTS